MERIIGIDLGSNSIGWAIRNLSTKENQIVDKGVLTFTKGVGEEKGVEVPMVKKRTESRSKRRNYQAEKYRKWELLEFLIEKKMCPLTIKELDSWKHYLKGVGRKYPKSEKFIQWLRFDFDSDGKPDFHLFTADEHESLYLFRLKAASDKEEDKIVFRQNPLILGRVFYQLVQRRGYRGRDDDEEEAKTILKGNEITGTHGHDDITPYIEKHKTLGAALYHLQKETGERIRKRYNLRTDYEKELKIICQVQDMTNDDFKRLWKAIIWQRPLRTQKGCIGICTFEKNKPRCPVSHPLYEEYRTWVLINNLKIELPENIERVKFLHDEIYPLFYNSSRDFKLSAIIKRVEKSGGILKSRFPADSKVISCNLLNSFKKIFGEDWKRTLGWNEILKNEPKKCPYSAEDIWHILFTFDSREKLFEFAQTKMNLDNEQADKFSKIRMQQGYATLSLSAIRKLLPFLRNGFIFSEAVYLANIRKVLGGIEVTQAFEKKYIDLISKTIQEHRTDNAIASVINSLISVQLNSEFRFGMDKDYNLDDRDRQDILNKIVEVFGSKTWNEKLGNEERDKIRSTITREYLSFLRKPISAKKESLFTSPSRLHEKIFQALQKEFNIPRENIKYLWHPSEQETYPEAKVYEEFIIDGEEVYIPVEKADDFRSKHSHAHSEGFTTKFLGDPRPISRGFKNPMAMRTMHELKKLINYLIKTRKIDEDTRVVIEISREELKDANMRKAIWKWQKLREKENNEYKEKIREIAESNPALRIDSENMELIAKYRLWIEQEKQCIYTGKTINCTDIFDGSRYNFEHTIPASMSFDNEYKNMTIADIEYNINIKGKKLPTECPNYNNTATINGKEYTAIKPRLKFMEEKVKHLQKSLDEWSNKTKFASTKEIKDACIQRRHMIKFDLEYWRKKLDTFTCVEYRSSWRNSQLKDTQIITKYALPYLKTIFNKVEVQKGSITAAFREIFGIQPKLEKKDRKIHSHHAVDAAVLTLIPSSAIRDQLLFRYNESKDRNSGEKYHEKVRNWDQFKPDYLLSIHQNVLINYQSRNTALVPAVKRVRKRGRQQFLKTKNEDGMWTFQLDQEGKRIPLIAKGDSIRGQLHKESFYGAVKVNGEIILVERVPLSSFTSLKECDNIVDESVKKIVRSTFETRIKSGVSFDKAKLEPVPFPSGKSVIKKVRCRVAAGRGYLTTKKAVPIRMHTFIASDQDYKHYLYAQNEEMTLCLLYEKLIENKIQRAFKLVGLYDLSRLKLKNFTDIGNKKSFQTMTIGRGKNQSEIALAFIITVGIKVIVYAHYIDEIKELSQEQLFRRVFRVYKFNEKPNPCIYLQNHNEARTNDILGTGEPIIDTGKYQSRLCLTAGNFSCAIEGKDFIVRPDGEIKFLF